jgi:hypothetical protein
MGKREEKVMVPIPRGGLAKKAANGCLTDLLGDGIPCSHSIKERCITMDTSRDGFRQAVGQLADAWISSGLPSRQAVDHAAEKLLRLRIQLGVQGLWTAPPLMLTATLDDGLGQGLAVIEKFAVAIGMRLLSLGLMQTPEAIISACHREKAAYLGLTVLQFDSEDDLIVISGQLPPLTRIIAGGPVFSADAELARRTGIHHVAKNVAYFLRFMQHAHR